MFSDILVQNIYSPLLFLWEVVMKANNINKSQKLLVTQQEMILIKNSNEVKDVELYGNLYNCIENYKKLSQADLDNNAVFDKKARIVLLNSGNKKMMLNRTISEWYSVKNFDVSESLINCQLCGRRNKYIFYIHNKMTGVELHIGSDCVKKFPDITGIKQQQKKMSQLQREQLQQKRKIEFEVCEGSELNFINDAEDKFKQFPVMLPYKLYNEIKDTIFQLNLSKTTYIKSGGNLDEVFKTFCALKDQFRNLYVQAVKHYEAVKNESLTCDRETSVWLMSNNQSIWDKVSKNKGIFDAETLAKVYDDRYVGKKLNEIMKHLVDKDIKMTGISKSFIHFFIKNNRYVYAITFTIPIRTFMERIGCYALTDQAYVFNKGHFNNISIEISRNNFQAVYNGFFKVLNKKGYDFIIEEKTLQAYWKKIPQYKVKNKWSNHVVKSEPLYKKSSVEQFLKALSPFLLKDESYLERNFESIKSSMESGRVWITQKEKNINKEATMYAKGMQKQREFIPY